MEDKGYKLTYFNARGLCEPIRFIFTVAEVNFEDVRVPIKYNGAVPVIPQVLPPEIKESKRNVQTFNLWLTSSVKKNRHDIRVEIMMLRAEKSFLHF